MLVKLKYVTGVGHKILRHLYPPLRKNRLKGKGQVDARKSAIQNADGYSFTVKSILMHLVKTQHLKLRLRGFRCAPCILLI